MSSAAAPAVFGHFGYFVTVFLMIAGLFIVIARGNLIKKLVGLGIFQTSVYLLYIAPGKLVVDTNVKKIQHPTGGVVGELLVKEGDRVKQGDVVVRLDGTQAKANLGIVTKALEELAARRAAKDAA